MNIQISYASVRSLEQQDKLQEAMKVARKLLAAYKQQTIPKVDYYKLILTMARICSKMGSDECLKYIKIALKNKPKGTEEIELYSNALYIRAIHYSLTDRLQESLSAYQENLIFINNYIVEDKDIFLASCYRGIATVYGKQGRRESINIAIEYLEKYVALVTSEDIAYVATVLYLVSLYLDLYNPVAVKKYIDSLMIAIQQRNMEKTEIGATAMAMYGRYWLAIGNIRLSMDYCLIGIERATEIHSHTITHTVQAFFSICLTCKKYCAVYEITDLFLRLLSFFPLVSLNSQRIYLLMTCCRAAALEQNKEKGAKYSNLLTQFIQEKNLPEGLYSMAMFYKYHTEIMCGLHVDYGHILDSIKSISSIDGERWEDEYLLLQAFCYATDSAILLKERQKITYSLMQKAEENYPIKPDCISHKYERASSKLLILQHIANEDEIREQNEIVNSYSKIFSMDDTNEKILDDFIYKSKYYFYKFAEYQQASQQEKCKSEIQQYKNKIANADTLLQQIRSDYVEVKQSLVEFFDEKVSIVPSKRTTTKLTEILYKIDSAMLESKKRVNAEANIDIECPTILRTKLLNIASNLSAKELKFCHLTLLGWGVSEICTTLGIQETTILKFRYRISRKLKVPKNTRLYEFLIEIDK